MSAAPLAPDALERERLYRAALSALTEPGDVRVATLLDELGPEGLYRELAYPSVPPRSERARKSRADVAARLAGFEPARALDEGLRAGLRFIIPGDREWPVSLDGLAYAPALQERGGVPLGLWVRGPLRLHEHTSAVAIVGTRDATDYGGAVAAEIASECARAGVTVVSGAASGIDACAHRGALAARRPTIAVLACGADLAYPRSNRELIDRIATDGAVVSEVSPGQEVRRVRFLARNRIIAALATGTVVVEAALRSGSLNTANWAERLHRHVMGVPGSVNSEVSRGAHELCRRGGVVVTRAADVLEVLGVSGEHLAPEEREPPRRRDSLTVEERQILDAVPVVDAAGAALIARWAGVDAVTVAAALRRLVSRRLVEQVPTGYRLTSEAMRD